MQWLRISFDWLLLFRFAILGAISAGGAAKLWEFAFDDITQPELGGQVRTIVNGQESVRVCSGVVVFSGLIWFFSSRTVCLVAGANDG